MVLYIAIYNHGIFASEIPVVKESKYVVSYYRNMCRIMCRRLVHIPLQCLKEKENDRFKMCGVDDYMSFDRGLRIAIRFHSHY